MAASLYSSKLSKSKYKNWIKAALGVLITKEGISPFVCDEIEQFQQKCLSDICNNNGLPVGTTCSGCCTENVVVCPTDRICNVGRGKCKFHRNAATQYIKSGCPGKICHNFKNEIQKAHRYSGPSYRNTDATKWCSNPLEMAKCFMPPDGYKDVVSAADTDFNGINSVIINCKHFKSKVHADLSKTNNIFDQAREVGKVVRHSPNLEVDDTDLQHYFTVLQNLLSDPGYLAADTDAQNAKQKLSQLLNDTLVLGKDDVQKVLDDAAKAVQDKIKNEKDEQNLVLIKTTNDSIKEIEQRGQLSMSELDKALGSAIDELEIKTHESVTKLQAETDKQLKVIAAEGDTVAEIAREKTEKIKSASDVTLKKIASETDKALRQIEEGINKNVTTDDEEKYKKRKKELKDGLATFYQDKHSTIPLSPLFEEKETPLEGFYVMPQMESIKMPEKFSSLTEIKTSVKSLSELFKSDTKVAREIYLIADAGFGKTSFSNYLAVTWCHAHRSDDQPSNEDHLNALSEFEFLFFVSLRESYCVCNIDDMIKEQILPFLSFSTPLSNEHFQEILHREKYLVILDGLDEWSHPNTDCTMLPKDVPHRIARKNCTVLTTTRPWKLSVINLKTSQIDRKIELVKLNEASAWQLQFNTIQKIHTDFDEGKVISQTDEFNEDIVDYDLEELQSVPVLLMFLISLWCDKIPLGQSKCELYTSIIELLLSRTFKRHPDLQPTCEHFQNEFPECLSEHEHCKKFYTLLTALGRLAFHTLFSETRENTLVFDSSVANKFLSGSELELSLLSGILTQSKVQVQLTKQTSKISFSHKSVQEYFSALYMSCQSECNVQKTVLEYCKRLQEILDMSAVFVFISGMNAKMMSSLSRELMFVISEDKITTNYRSIAWYDYENVHPLKELQDMYISCIKENPDNKDLRLCLQDFIIDEEFQQENYKTNLQRLANQNKNNITSVSVKNIGFDSLQKVIDLFALSELSNLQKIYFRGECKEADVIRLLPATVKCAGIISRERRGGHLIDKRCSLSPALCRTFKSLSQLEAMYISCFEMSHDVLEEFLSYVVIRKSMKEIRLQGLYCTDHGTTCAGYNLNLSQHSDLRALGLLEIPLSQLNMNVSSLEECDVGELYKPGLVSTCFSQLPAARKLKTLRCVSLRSPNDIETLLQTLPLLVQVKEVELWSISLGARSLTLTPEMVNIDYVWLHKVTMSSSSFRDLVKRVEYLPHSVRVIIRGCTITPEIEFGDVKKYIQTSENIIVSFDGDNQFNEYVFEFVKSELPPITSDLYLRYKIK